MALAMNGALNSLSSSLYSPQSQSRQLAEGTLRYQEAMERHDAASISLTTSEGDVVTISSLYHAGGQVSLDSRLATVRGGMSFTAASLSFSSLEMTVSGDLSEEELNDIAALLDDLSAIAEDFYSGDSTAAVEAALGLGDMGSISRMSATFTYQQRWSSTCLTDYHPLPAASELQDGFGSMDLASLFDQATSDEMEYAEMLRAQWRQIKEFLEARRPHASTSEPRSKPDEEQESPAARRMMTRVLETMQRHPRLTPLSLPLAHEAIDSDGSRQEFSAKAISEQKNILKDNVTDAFHGWLYGA